MDAALTSRPRGSSRSPVRSRSRSARRDKGGARAVRVGLGASRPAAGGRLVSFGLARARSCQGSAGRHGAHGVRGSSTRPAPCSGKASRLAVPARGRPCSARAGRVVDDPGERAALARRTGAVAVDMESASLAATGRSAGAVRAISDVPERPVGKLARGFDADGAVAWGVVVGASVTEPRRMLRARPAGRAGARLARARRGCARRGSR